MKLFRFSAAALTAFLLAAPAFALDFQSAKSQGLVGEAMTGYIAPVNAASPEVNTLVLEVNAKRRLEYQRISGENGQPLSVVEKLAAGKIFDKLEKGAYYKAANGSWAQK